MDRATLAVVRQADDAPSAAPEAERSEQAIYEAWQRYRPLVRWTLVKMLGPHDEEVRDLSQETFVQLHRSMHALRSPEAIRGFVTGIAVRLALQEIRRRRVRGGQVLLPGQGPVPLASADADPEAREAVAHLLLVVTHLRAADREMFVLRQIEGLEQTEICTATGLSISTVRRRLRRLERRLEVLLRDDPALAGYVLRGTARRSS